MADPLNPKDCGLCVSNSQFSRKCRAEMTLRGARLNLRCLAHEGPPANPASLGPMTTLCSQSGVRAVIAENLPLKQQLIVLLRS